MPRGRSLCRRTDIMFFQNPSYKASRQLVIPWITAVGTSFSPLPCQARHNYMITGAHRVEVEVGADGPASAPLSGAAAAAPPAGAPLVGIYHRYECLLLCSRVIAKASHSYRRAPWQRKPKGKGTSGTVRITRRQKSLAISRDIITYVTGGATDGNHLWLWFSPQCSEGRGKHMIGGELRLMERILVSDEARMCGSSRGLQRS
jgi:hypothetical protein